MLESRTNIEAENAKLPNIHLGEIFMLFVYPKNEADNLSDAQTNALAKLVKEVWQKRT